MVQLTPRLVDCQQVEMVKTYAFSSETSLNQIDLHVLNESLTAPTRVIFQSPRRVSNSTNFNNLEK